jgi:signal peptidase I
MTDNDQATARDSADTLPRVSRWRRVRTELGIWLRTLTSAGVYAAFIVTFGFQIARVEGRSMEPTLHDQDRLVVNKLAYQLHNPAVGDVVMLRHPSQPDQVLVKRIVAAPGDTVAFEHGVVLRNGEVVEEEFVQDDLRSDEDRPPVVVPEGCYFVLGDHRNNSSDSRTFGPVPAKYILGRIQLRWWPIPDARFFGL